MPKIPFPLGLEGEENLPHTRRSLQNCWNSLDGQIIKRPGITAITTTGFVARGQFVWNGSLYQVASQNLIKITNTTTGAFSVIGTIAGNEVVETAIGFNTAVIVVKGSTGRIYTLNKSDTLVDIRGNSNFVSSTDVAHINGRFVYIPFNGDPAFFSDVGAAGTVQSTSFFDAEELPDLNNSVFNFSNDLYIGGTDSFQIFRNVTSTQVFAGIQGSRIDNGYIGALIEYNETFLFIGREKEQDFGIYAIGQGTAPKISNHAVDLILSTYSQDQLKAALGSRYKWRGYDIAVFTLPDDTLGFYGGNWHVLDTEINGTTETWSAGFLTQFEGTYFSAFEDKIGKLSTLNTDYGEAITRIIDIGFQAPENDFFSCQSIELGISQGFSSDPGTVAIRMSKDNVLFGPHVYKDLGDLGKYANKLEWNDPGGLGSYNGFMGARIYTRGDVNFSADYFNANFR